MEALILILIDALAPLLAPLVGGFLALITSACSAVLTLLFHIAGALLERFFGSRLTSADSAAPPVRRPSTWRRWIRWGLFAASGLTAAVLLRNDADQPSPAARRRRSLIPRPSP